MRMFSRFFLCFLPLFFSLGFFSNVLIVQAFTGTYGINYGKIADNIPSPENVVVLLKAAKIKNVRIYDADHSVLTAFKGSGLEIVVGLGNEYLKDISVNEDRALDWVKENVEPFLPGTRIRGIAVGNEVLGGDQELSEALLGAVKNVYNALDKLHLTGVVQVSSPHSQGVFANSYPPSACVFKENLVQYMKPLLEFFSQIGTPFFINAYPFLAYISDPEHIDLNYALLQPNPGIVDQKTNLHYSNMFEAQIDAAYAALEAAGFPNMEVIVSETGWASRGDANEVGATAANARTYNYNLRKRLAKKKGTPFRPKKVVKAYIFALFNEDLKPGPTSERNFGLFKADGSISYDIGFKGLKPSSAVSLKDIWRRGWTAPYSMVLMTCAAVLLLA
ncbi:glucan endo-1,3-beta-glucosidase 14-like [Telopea speciosissima]|uniref:glucan endo-1,3-beta-glucosidase 14-like n=1 Tax=Telopea speciosissima TaxID=54955 RepID=UPI001CC698FA|nr:glucan endo-1,3-beta-glucosidase 14-like [Telopea speciosissima]XP_043723356.1 glucan endo-1,3-beta-glucosidase 14-like [Telopea speciosissima]XP_043723357.1 glucan endo-1,3-beta-glucosidase 14-like [Telopea speciosissima]